MTDLALRGSRVEPLLRLRAVEWVLAHLDVVAIVSLMALAAVLRYWDLGTMALHHDESLHAQYSWYLYDGRGYEHNPLMHGPWLFHTGALIYFLFGDSDATARFLPALFGTLLVGMPFLLRKQLGMKAVLIAAVLLTFSPTLLYFSRFYRNDIYIAVWTLAMVICIWRYLDEGRNLYLYGLALFMALAFATKEVTFITVAIFLVFLNLMFAVELGRRREGEEIRPARVALRTLLIAPVAWVIAGLWPLFVRQTQFRRFYLERYEMSEAGAHFAGAEPRGASTGPNHPSLAFGLERMPRVGAVLLIVGTLSLPQFSAGIQVLPFVTDHGYNNPAEAGLRNATVLALLVVAVYAGMLWNPKAWAIAAACFFVPYVLLYTTFFTHLDGFFSGIWGSLDYWLDQHGVRRGDQPDYYYALLTPLYEFLPLVLALAGAVWLALRGDSLRRWLLFWLAGIFVGLSIAGEKMPWLEVHIALPLILIAAVALSAAIDALELRGSRWITATAGAVVTAAAVLLIVDGSGVARIAGLALGAGLLVWFAMALLRDRPEAPGYRLAASLSSPDLHLTLGVLALAVGLLLAASLVPALGVDAWAAAWVMALIPLAFLGYLLGGMMLAGKGFGRALMVVAVAALFTLTVRASITAAFTHRDTPVEMIVYTQTSRDVPMLRDRIDALAERSGLGHNLPIVVDNADSFAWPWAWYLRDYHDVSFSNIGPDYTPPPGAVLLINRANALRIQDPNYTRTPYKHRWWFNETYRGLTFHSAASIVASREGLGSLLDFFFYRRPVEGNTGSVDGVAFFPHDLSAFDRGPTEDVPPREPTLLADGRVLIGSEQGSRGAAIRGELWQPAGLFLDAEGYLWVADGRNHRVQKFDLEGNFVAALGRSGAQLGAFSEPWSLVVDADGFVYVADTWNHRIQKFSPDLEFVAAWGEPYGGPDPGPLDLFGPRDLVIAGDGTLWLTDTGNKRLLQFSLDGEPLAQTGTLGSGPGQFSEPVGLALDADGNFYVADAWNSRIQRFTPGLEPAGEFPVPWTSQEVLAKPYAAVLADGRILASDPAGGRLLLFDAEGNQLGAWQPLPNSMPVGVVALPDGGFAFSDVNRNEIQVVPGALIEGFFQ